MKANELMMGDWAIHYGHPTKITGLSPDIYQNDEIHYYFFNDVEWYHIDELEPILLTEEILEKNSFLEVEAIEYPSHRVGISFLYRVTSEGLRIFVQNACVGGPTCTMIKTCKYVHEVQHMIKMCDIEKNIIL